MGKIIAFTGVDGTGKTTIAKMIVDSLGRDGIKVKYHHELDFLFIKYIYKYATFLLSKKNRYNTKESIISMINKNTSVVSELYYVLVWLDNWIRLLYFKLIDDTIICDRWIYDYLSMFEIIGYTNSVLYRLYSAFPNPDYLILFTVNPNIAMKRKQKDPGHYGDSIAFYENRQKIILKNCNIHGYDKKINANVDVPEVYAEVYAYVKQIHSVNQL